MWKPTAVGLLAIALGAAPALAGSPGVFKFVQGTVYVSESAGSA
jgi:hypothetical protein